MRTTRQIGISLLHRSLFIINKHMREPSLRVRESLALVHTWGGDRVDLLHDGLAVVVLWDHLDILGQDLVDKIHLLTEAVLVDHVY